MMSTEFGMRPSGTARRLAPLLLLSIVVLSPSVGFASEPVTEANVAEKLTNASSAEDHDALAAYFLAQAAKAATEVEHHEKMLTAIRRAGKKTYRYRGNRLHCRELIRSFRGVQEAFEDLAADQETAAKAIAP